MFTDRPKAQLACGRMVEILQQLSGNNCDNSRSTTRGDPSSRPGRSPERLNQSNQPSSEITIDKPLRTVGRENNRGDEKAGNKSRCWHNTPGAEAPPDHTASGMTDKTEPPEGGSLLNQVTASAQSVPCSCRPYPEF